MADELIPYGNGHFLRVAAPPESSVSERADWGGKTRRISLASRQAASTRKRNTKITLAGKDPA